MSQAGLNNTSGGGGASSAPIQQSTTVLTSTQVKNLTTTPITLIPAQGSGKVIHVLSAAMKMTYGGTNAFVQGDPVKFAFYDNPTFNTWTSLSDIFLDAFIEATANAYTLFMGTYVNVSGGEAFLATQCENLPVVLTNVGPGNITGNAANNNTVTVTVQYVVLNI